MFDRAKKELRLAGSRVVLTYAVFAALWILLSDKLLGLLVTDHARLVEFVIFKDWAFVVTSILLFVLVRRLLRQISAVHESEMEALQAGQKNLALLTAITDGTDDAIFAKDAEGRYMLANKAACKILGKPPNEIIGCNDTVLFPPEQAASIMAVDRWFRSTGKIESNEEILQTSNGEAMLLSTKGPLRDAAGNIVGNFGISRDITARQKIERALQHSEGRLSEVKQIAGLGYWHWDLLSGEHVWDDEVNALYGLPAGAPPVAYPEVRRYFTPASWETLAQAVNACVGGGAPYECDVELVRPDGGRHWMDDRARAGDPQRGRRGGRAARHAAGHQRAQGDRNRARRSGKPAALRARGLATRFLGLEHRDRRGRP